MHDKGYRIYGDNGDLNILIIYILNQSININNFATGDFFSNNTKKSQKFVKNNNQRKNGGEHVW